MNVNKNCVTLDIYILSYYFVLQSTSNTSSRCAIHTITILNENILQNSTQFNKQFRLRSAQYFLY